jgi:hypothetical protein
MGDDLRTHKIRSPRRPLPPTPPVEAGDELDDCGEHHRVVRVEQPPSEAGFGRAWAELGMAERATGA